MVAEGVRDEVRAVVVVLAGVAVRAEVGDGLAEVAGQLCLRDHGVPFPDGLYLPEYT